MGCAAAWTPASANDYVLILPCIKYGSDKGAGKRHAMTEVPEGDSFENMVIPRGGKEIGGKINMIIGCLAEANDLKSIIDEADYNDEE